MSSMPKIALIHDRLNVRGGAERVLEEIAGMYPAAPIYTLIYNAPVFSSSPIADHEIRTSLINRLPGAANHHRIYIPLMPMQVERLRLDGFDILLSSSAAFAHGIRTRPDQLHISYIHAPMRYAWHQYRVHVAQFGYGSIFVRILLAYLRAWDRKAAQRADFLLTNSHWTAAKIKEAFGREATVIYPPVHVERFHPSSTIGDYYLTVCRLVPYKRVDLIMKAFNQLKLPLVIVGEGPERKKLLQLAAPNVTFLPFQPQVNLNKLMAEAKAFVYAAEEDFGIAAVEAQAAGCPVIAFDRGGLTETVADGISGLFFNQQSEEAIIEAVERFNMVRGNFVKPAISKNAERFGSAFFVSRLSEFVSEKFSEFADQKSRSGSV
jgi:glycosyltransferase involved in cell wall biosynthesis